jgi:hypothetical protein
LIHAPEGREKAAAYSPVWESTFVLFVNPCGERDQLFVHWTFFKNGSAKLRFKKNTDISAFLAFLRSAIFKKIEVNNLMVAFLARVNQSMFLRRLWGLGVVFTGLLPRFWK